nr:hypothetical protein Iba_scaffold1678323CG0010 [Ipomoea batatas]
MPYLCSVGKRTSESTILALGGTSEKKGKDVALATCRHELAHVTGETGKEFEDAAVAVPTCSADRRRKEQRVSTSAVLLQMTPPPSLSYASRHHRKATTGAPRRHRRRSLPSSVDRNSDR